MSTILCSESGHVMTEPGKVKRHLATGCPACRALIGWRRQGPPQAFAPRGLDAVEMARRSNAVQRARAAAAKRPAGHEQNPQGETVVDDARSVSLQDVETAQSARSGAEQTQPTQEETTASPQPPATQQDNEKTVMAASCHD